MKKRMSIVMNRRNTKQIFRKRMALAGATGKKENLYEYHGTIRGCPRTDGIDREK